MPAAAFALAWSLCALISRQSFQVTQSSSSPPASVSPMICSSLVVTTAKPTRSTVAATMPVKMTFAR